MSHVSRRTVPPRLTCGFAHVCSGRIAKVVAPQWWTNSKTPSLATRTPRRLCGVTTPKPPWLPPTSRARHRNWTRSSAYTSAMFSETRYALNGDLRVAYRASREGPRDIVFVPNWFTYCEDFPELPSLQGWVEAMTSLGRLIFFDQPGTEPPIPSRRARCRPWSNGPTASPRCSTISEVNKRSSSRAPVRSRQRRCSRRHIRLAPPRWSSLRAPQIRL